MNTKEFVAESNRIEGIIREPTVAEIKKPPAWGWLHSSRHAKGTAGFILEGEVRLKQSTCQVYATRDKARRAWAFCF